MATLDFTTLFKDRGAARGVDELAKKFSQASSSASDLEVATKRLAAAESKAADAAGQMRVAETRLQQTRNNAKATVAQRVAAEENLAKAQRRLTGAQQDVTVSSRRLVTAQRTVGQATQQSAQKVEQSSGRLAALGSATSKFGGIASVAFTAAGAAAVGFGLKVASGNEQATVGFTTMLGSAQKAQVFLKQLQQFAATTPFEFPELQTAASSLISAGVNANKVIPIMRTLGDVTSGMGTGAEGIRRATIALQQMNAAGRITAEDLNQLRDAGIPVYDLLAAATHKSKSEVVALAQAGKLGRKELEQMMAALESGKGLERFNGLMQEQSKTLAGMVSTLKDVSGQFLAGFLQPLFPALKASIGALADMGTGAKTTFAVIGSGAAVFGLAAAGALKLSGAFRALGASASAARIATGGVGAALGVATLAFGVYANEHAKAKQRVADFTQALQGETDAVQKNVAAVAAKQLQDAGAFSAAQKLGLGLDLVTRAALGERGALDQVNSVIDAYVAAGLNSADVDANDRANAANDLGRAIGRTGGAYNKAVTEAKQMEAATGGAAGAMGGMEKKTESAKEALQRWRTEMFRSARAALELQGSQDAVEAAVDDATKAVKTNGKTLDNNTAKGRDNREALRNLATSSLNYREKLIAQGASQKRVTNVTQDARQEFIKTAIKMGATREQAVKLADKFGLLDKKINGLNSKNVNIHFATNAKGVYKTFKGFAVNLTSPSHVGSMATGGMVRGPGTPTSDSIPTMLSNGEFVVNAAAVKRHRQLLEAINKNQVPEMAGGGYVNIRPGKFPAGAMDVPGGANAFSTAFAKATGNRLGSALAKVFKSMDFGGPGGGITGAAGGRVRYKGGTFTKLFARNLELIQRAARVNMRIFQGGFRPRTSYSGTSHAGDAVDFQVNYRLGRAFRKYVGAAGDRTGLGHWSPHIHAVPSPSHGRAGGSAIWQYRDYVRRGGARQSMRSPWGLAAGGTLSDPSTVRMSEFGPEKVLTTAQTKSFDRLVRVMDRSGGAANTYITINAPHYVGNQDDLRRTLVDMNRRGQLEVIKR